MRVSVLGPALLFLVSARAQETSEGILTIQTSVPPSVGTSGGFGIETDTTSNTITVPQATTGLVTSAEMSIPPGETPITTGLSSTGSPSGGSETPSTTGSGAPEQSTGAAPAGVVVDGGSGMFALAMSGLSVMLGVAWTSF
ncbi:hypothetical protein BU26DRAFT_523718 [Trematosphaeria pertusa]|uniref:Uncharacterized protein n=1 Tax=Trematosphaeria pertusa TaxID=390896 RepID=A0A6A6I0I7_9PLEO|nr:uncharacterized protein BU26DRAFT_523718 [Trematosphaeria pertusa]KAF2243403.1 hypothetical protein BU26DRAFT_523718 [Trematosphaeria pertusa]